MISLLLLLASLLPLVIAPFLARRAGRAPATVAGLDSFVAVTIGGVTLTHVLPHSVHDAGRVALLVALAGFLLPLAMHYGMHRLEHRALPGLVFMVLIGLAVHATGDGIALVRAGSGNAGSGDPHVPLLALAVLLHRLPVALAIWWFARPALGRAVAYALLAAIGLGTVGGFLLGRGVGAVLSAPAVALAEAFVAGMLFHVLIGHHRPVMPEDQPAIKSGFFIGLIAGTFLVLATFGVRLGVISEAGHALDQRTLLALIGVVGYVTVSRLRGSPEAHSHDH